MILDCKVPHRKQSTKATKSGGTRLPGAMQLYLWRKLLSAPPVVLGPSEKLAAKLEENTVAVSTKSWFWHADITTFPALKMCYKVLHFVSSALVSIALLSFSCRVPRWLFLHNSYQLDSCTKSVEFSLLASLRTTLSPISRLLQISFATLLLRLSAFSKPAEIRLQSMRS